MGQPSLAKGGPKEDQRRKFHMHIKVDELWWPVTKKLGPRPLLRGLDGIKGLIILIESKNIKCILFHTVSFVSSTIKNGYRNVKILGQLGVIKDA